MTASFLRRTGFSRISSANEAAVALATGSREMSEQSTSKASDTPGARLMLQTMQKVRASEHKLYSCIGTADIKIVEHSIVVKFPREISIAYGNINFSEPVTKAPKGLPGQV